MPGDYTVRRVEELVKASAVLGQEYLIGLSVWQAAAKRDGEELAQLQAMVADARAWLREHGWNGEAGTLTSNIEMAYRHAYAAGFKEQAAGASPEDRREP